MNIHECPKCHSEMELVEEEIGKHYVMERWCDWCECMIDRLSVPKDGFIDWSHAYILLKDTD